MSIQDLVLYDVNNGGLQSDVTELNLWEISWGHDWSSNPVLDFGTEGLYWYIEKNSLGSVIHRMKAYKFVPNVDISDYSKLHVVVASKSESSPVGLSGYASVQFSGATPERGAGLMDVGTNEFLISDIIDEGTGAILLYPEQPNFPYGIGYEYVSAKISKVWLSGPESDPPSKPSSITYPLSIKAGAKVNIQWEESVDPDGDLAGYIVEKSINNGAAWNQIYQGSTNSCVDTIQSGIQTVMYRVKAYDSHMLYSDYTTGSVANVIANTPPTVPPSITVPLQIISGQVLTISWGESTDAEGDALQYRLERSIDNKATWTTVTVTEENKRYYSGIVSSDWTQVAYRVCALEKDSGVESGYRVSDNRVIESHTPPVVDIEPIAGSKTEAFDVEYSVTSEYEGTISIVEKVDGIVVAQKTGESPISEVLEVTSDIFVSLTNGNHNVSVEATDSFGSKTIATEQFLKNSNSAIIKPKNPILPENENDSIDECILTINGYIPEDAAFSIKVTNNANDTTPVWETLTSEEISGKQKHTFQNSTASQGFAFSFIIEAEKGTSEDGGYITSIQGAFKKN